MSPDGEAIVTGAGDETLRFWNVFNKARSHKVLTICCFCCCCRFINNNDDDYDGDDHDDVFAVSSFN